MPGEVAADPTDAEARQQGDDPNNETRDNQLDLNVPADQNNEEDARVAVEALQLLRMSGMHCLIDRNPKDACPTEEDSKEGVKDSLKKVFEKNKEHKKD